MEISIAKDFSPIPGARFPEEGDYSGKDFRNDILCPALKKAIEKAEVLTVILDGTAGLGTSFLEESFGGLIRNDNYSLDTLKKYIVFISEEDPDYITEINQYMEEAYAQSNKK